MKDSFVLFTDGRELVDELSDEQAGKLLKAIYEYQSGGDPDIDDQATLIVFKAMKKQMDICAERYEKTKQARQAAGKLGGRPEKQNKANQSNEKQNKANQSKEKQTEAKKPVSESESVSDLKEKTPKGVQKKSGFAAPTHEEVEEYVRSQGYAVDAGKFVDFYASNGWMVGRNPMKDWKAAVRNWARSQRQESTANGRQEKTASNKFNNFPQRDYDWDALEAALLKAQ